MLEFTTYRESTDTPMIFLPCGHFYTVDTFDGVVHMTDFFEFNSPDGWKITKRYVQESSTPEIPRCPDCRAAYTTSARYNEVVKKAQLQISIRQFTLTSNDRLISLIRDINLLQDTFESSRDAFQAVHRKALSERYRALSILQGRLRAYNKQVLTEEQPYHRVYELATYACRRYDLSPETYNPSVVQYRFGIEGAYQELRLMFLQICDMDIIASKDSTPEQLQKIMWKKIATDANTAITQGKKLVEICKHRKQQLIEIQTRIVVARFMALALKHRDEIKGGGDALAGRDGSELRSEAVEDLEECLDICAIIPSCQRLEGDVQETIRAVQGGTFYSVVTGSEMKQVYEAMANEFRGTGHWYVCSNGHQFTVGECGMPVSLGVCNECGARIGGQNHSPAAGVRADMNLERRMMDMTL
ncbi:uncharacterized protein DFL_005497 [Arthrobotrys flagrans]|uniref:RZ-type domain-containing protein n=1 Tax=Arthrobotrys flagrans TaxID=97331 RepID=A0A436ZXL7_ARTFL|nr:hypothetical protein DFL_005497 [Arthrobotrys flagrans]